MTDNEFLDEPQQIAALDGEGEKKPFNSSIRLRGATAQETARVWAERYPNTAVVVWRNGREWSHGTPYALNETRSFGQTILGRRMGARLSTWERVSDMTYFQVSLMRGYDGFAAIGAFRHLKTYDACFEVITRFLRRMTTARLS